MILDHLIDLYHEALSTRVSLIQSVCLYVCSSLSLSLSLALSLSLPLSVSLSLSLLSFSIT
jgi:hypothetical protein